MAVEMAPSYGIEVIPGIEISSKEGHVLALFISRPISPGLSLERTVHKVVEMGGLCIIPHPMSNSKMGVSPHAILRAMRNPHVAAGLAGFEAFNAGLTGSQRQIFALQMLNHIPLAQVGCSDAHVDWMIGQGVTSFPGQSAADLRLALESRQTKAIAGHEMTPTNFIAKYVPRLILRYAGWVSWNAGPSEPLRFVWSGFRGRRLQAYHLSIPSITLRQT
jgi:predicted metal-dependent phosphoesterase TrpH